MHIISKVKTPHLFNLLTTIVLGKRIQELLRTLNDLRKYLDKRNKQDPVRKRRFFKIRCKTLLENI